MFRTARPTSLLPLALCAAASASQAPCELRLASATPQLGEREGQQVDYSDGRAMLGSPERAGGGRVTLHEVVAGVWTEVADLASPTPTSDNDRFGWAVAIDGDRAVVGAPFAGTPQGFQGPGAAYVFERDAGTGTWSFVQELQRSATQTWNDRFGFSVDMDGDLLAVGAFGDGTSAANAGAVYVFRHDGTSYVEEQKLTASTVQTAIRLGTCVAVDGDTIVSGAPYEDVGAVSNGGAAYVFERDLGTGLWSETARLTSPSPQPSDFFGISASLSGDRVVAGAEGVSGSGRAFVHERSLGAGWGLEATLAPRNPVAGLTFGQGVRILGDRVAVNARQATVLGQAQAGEVELFERGAGGWSYSRTVNKAAPAVLDEFGTGVVLGPDLILVGCPGDDSTGVTDAGGAYLFDLTDCDGDGVSDACQLAGDATLDLNRNGVLDRCEAVGSTYCNPNTPNSTGLAGEVTLLGSPEVAQNDLRVTARQLPPNAFGFFLTSTTPGSVFPVANSQGTLCIIGNIGRGAGGGIINSGALGVLQGQLDLAALPQPTGAVAAQPGETWHFQAWHRDAVGGQTTSNFTDAVAVTFQ